MPKKDFSKPMPIPDYESLMLPVLNASARAETSVPLLANEIADELGLSESERNVLLPSGRQRLLHNRIHWAKFYLNRAGLIDIPRRGRFITSPAGRSMLATNPSDIDVEMLLQIPQFKEFYSKARGETASPPNQSTSKLDLKRADAATPEERIETAHLELESALRLDLLQRMLQNSPNFFEAVIIELLVKMGYGGSHKNAAQQLGRSGDGGVDGVISEDRLGLDRVYIQAKRYREGLSVGRPDVQAFVGSLVGLGATKGVFVTTSTFSVQAVEFVRHLSQRVVLIDGPQLADLMIEHDVGVRSSRTIDFKRVDEDFFAEDE
jgi:restriction system protein